MRQIVLVLFFALSSAVASGQKIDKKRITDASGAAREYNLTMHVKHSEITVDSGQIYFRLWGLIEGKNFELVDGVPGNGSYLGVTLLHPGAYKARLSGVETKAGQRFARTYELLFSDGTHHNFTVIGESE